MARSDDTYEVISNAVNDVNETRKQVQQAQSTIQYIRSHAEHHVQGDERLQNAASSVMSALNYLQNADDALSTAAGLANEVLRSRHDVINIDTSTSTYMLIDRVLNVACLYDPQMEIAYGPIVRGEGDTPAAGNLDAFVHFCRVQYGTHPSNMQPADLSAAVRAWQTARVSR